MGGGERKGTAGDLVMELPLGLRLDGVKKLSTIAPWAGDSLN